MGYYDLDDIVVVIIHMICSMISDDWPISTCDLNILLSSQWFLQCTPQPVGGALHNVMKLKRPLQRPTSADRKVQCLIINTLSTQHWPWPKIWQPLVRINNLQTY